MKILRRHWLIVILTILAVATIAVFRLKGNDNPQYFTARVDRGDIRQVVESTGTINAVTTVQVEVLDRTSCPAILGRRTRVHVWEILCKQKLRK